MPMPLQIADAVVTELANAPAGTFSQAFTPERRVLPQFELSQLSDIKVAVVPRGIEIDNHTRMSSQYTIQIDIGVQKRLGKDLEVEVEPMMQLVEEIIGHMRRLPLRNAPTAVWVRTRNEPIYSSEHLAEQRVFISVITVTYLMVG